MTAKHDRNLYMLKAADAVPLRHVDEVEEEYRSNQREIQNPQVNYEADIDLNSSLPEEQSNNRQISNGSNESFFGLYPNGQNRMKQQWNPQATSSRIPSSGLEDDALIFPDPMVNREVGENERNLSNLSNQDREDDADSNTSIPIEDVIDQYIQVRADGFYNLNEQLPVLRRLQDKIAKERRTSDNSDSSVGKTFEKVFPSTSAGLRNSTQSSNLRPTMNRLNLQAQELKTFYEMQRRSARASVREAKSVDQRFTAMEQWIQQFEKSYQQTLDSESQQIGLLRVVRHRINKARMIDNANQSVSRNINGQDRLGQYQNSNLSYENSSDGSRNHDGIIPDTGNSSKDESETHTGFDDAQSSSTSVHTPQIESVKLKLDYGQDPRYDTDPEREYHKNAGGSLTNYEEAESNHDESSYGILATAIQLGSYTGISIEEPVAQTSGFCFVSAAVPIDDFHGYKDEDLLSWLVKFNYHYNNLTKEAKMKENVQDIVKAVHLIAKL